MEALDRGVSKVQGTIDVACHVLDVREWERTLDVRESSIVPRYQAKARATRSRTRSLAELGVGVLLGDVLGVRSDEHLLIDAFGKPALAEKGTEISIAHAGSLVVLACSSNPVGVDVEPMPHAVGKPHRLVLERAYGTRLGAIVGRPLECIDPRLFCELWTRVEAAVKLDGRGLRVEPRDNPDVVDGPNFNFIEYRDHMVAIATQRKSRALVKLFAHLP